MRVVLPAMMLRIVKLELAPDGSIAHYFESLDLWTREISA